MADMTQAPTRKTNETDLDTWNQALRSSPLYAEFMQTIGVNPGQPIRLTKQQQESFEKFLAARGVQIPDGMHIDPAGNLNQKNSLWKNIGVGAAIGGAALTGLGAAGIGPLGGLLGSSTVVPGAVGASGSAASGIPGASLGAAGFGGAGAAGSGISSATLGAGGFAGGAGATGSGILGATVAPGTFAAGAGGVGAAAGSAAAAGGGSSLLSKIANYAKDPDVLGAIGSGLSAGADTAAHNRGVNMSAEETAQMIRMRQDQQYRDAMVQRAQEGRASGSDAWRKLNSAEYVAGRTSDYTPREGLPSYGFGPKASTPAQIAAAAAQRDEAMGRLQGGNPLPAPTAPTPFEFQTQGPGMFERIAGIAGPGLSFWGGLSRLAPQRRR